MACNWRAASSPTIPHCWALTLLPFQTFPPKSAPPRAHCPVWAATNSGFRVTIFSLPGMNAMYWSPWTPLRWKQTWKRWRKVERSYWTRKDLMQRTFAWPIIRKESTPSKTAAWKITRWSGWMSRRWPVKHSKNLPLGWKRRTGRRTCSCLVFYTGCMAAIWKARKSSWKKNSAKSRKSLRATQRRCMQGTILATRQKHSPRPIRWLEPS